MRKFTVLGAIVIAAMFALCAPQPAGAFISNQNGIATAAHATINTIEVKRSLKKGTPPGWHHGKKGLARRRKTAWPKVTENLLSCNCRNAWSARCEMPYRVHGLACVTSGKSVRRVYLRLCKRQR